MSLFLILGFNGPYRESVPDVLYVGGDGQKAEKIRKASPHPRFLVLRDPAGHRRENPTPGVVDVETLRALAPIEEREEAEAYEKDLRDAFERGGNAAAKHYAQEMKSLVERVADLEKQLAEKTAAVISMDAAIRAPIPTVAAPLKLESEAAPAAAVPAATPAPAAAPAAASTPAATSASSTRR